MTNFTEKIWLLSERVSRPSVSAGFSFGELETPVSRKAIPHGQSTDTR